MDYGLHKINLKYLIQNLFMNPTIMDCITSNVMVIGHKTQIKKCNTFNVMLLSKNFTIMDTIGLKGNQPHKCFKQLHDKLYMNLITMGSIYSSYI